MARSYIEIPYGTSSPGIALGYGDYVPEGAVNLAYVQTKIPPVPDVVVADDDLQNAEKFVGNSIDANVRELALIGGQVIDPETNLPWTAPTDNVLFTTITAPFTDAAGATTQIPLFYSQALRFPVSFSGLPENLRNAIIQDYIVLVGEDAIAPNEALEILSYYQRPELAQLNSLVSIQSESGKPLPLGYLWQVQGVALDGDDLYIQVYTNFQGTYRQRYIVKWGDNSETLNVVPTFFQQLKATADQPPYTYIAAPIQDNSVGSLELTTTMLSATSNSTATIVANLSSTSGNVAHSAPISNGSTPSITASTPSATGSGTIPHFGENVFYTNSSSGSEIHNGTAFSYPTPANTVAPTSASSAITVDMSTVNVQSDANGSSCVAVQILAPNSGTVLQTWFITTPQTLTYYNASAVPGAYTVKVYGSVTPTPQNTNSAIYSYNVSWQGSYAYHTPLATVYSNVNGNTTSYTTPTGTVGPISAATQLSLNITSVSLPSDGNGTTIYNVALYSPASNVTPVMTWSVMSAQTLSYFNTGAPGGVWTWSIYASVIPTNQGTGTYGCALTATMGWFIYVSSTTYTYTSNPGTPGYEVTPVNTLAPLSSNDALTLDLTGVSCPSNAAGISSLSITLTSPLGVVAQTWEDITTPQTFTYYNLNAVGGQWTWAIIANVVNTNTATGTYYCSWEGSYSWYEIDPTSEGDNSQQRTLAFSFSLPLPDGTIYATTDNGPQIFLQEPDNLDASRNWYLRMHRGWLTYTDPSDNTYLVGLEPYYTQNFDELIPLIAANNEQAEILNYTTIQVQHTPMFVDPNYPIDVIVTRRTPSGITDLWVTRDNLTAAGAYLPSAITDINGARGTITLGNVTLTSNDIVHVNYSYLEYYYVYRGFPDQFDRFIHLDVNPAGGHTWFNLWNINNNPNQDVYQDNSSPVVTSYLEAVDTPTTQLHPGSAAGTASIVTSSVSEKVQFNQVAINLQSASITTSSSGAPVVTTLAGSAASIATISALPLTLTSPGSASKTSYDVETTSISATPSTTNAQRSESQTSDDVSLPTITSSSTTGTGRVTDTGSLSVTGVINTTQAGTHYNHTATMPYVGGTYAPQTFSIHADVAPTTPTTQLTFSISQPGFSVSNLGQGMVDEYLFNQFDVDNGVPTETSGPIPSFHVFVELISPEGYNIGSWQVPTGNSTYTIDFSNWTTTGTYTWLVGMASSTGGETWSDNYPLAANLGLPNTMNYTGAVSLSALQNTTVSSYNPQPGAVTSYYTTATTLPPVNQTQRLTFTLSSLFIPSDAYGSTTYNVQLVGPTGAILLSQLGLTSGTSLTYLNPTAPGGVYTWNVWANAISNNTGASSYSCSATVNWTWMDIHSTTTYTYAAVPGTANLIQSSPNTLAPTSSATAISLALSNIAIPGQDNFGTPYYEIGLYSPNGALINTWTVSTNSPQTFTYWNPIAQAGSWVWAIQANVTVKNAGTSSYNCSLTAVNTWYEMQGATNFLYQSVQGLATQLVGNALTVAPTTSGTQLSLTLSGVTCPSDSNGASSLTIKLLSPSGATIQSHTGVTSGTTYTYSNVAAPAGSYTWVIYAVCTSTNGGVGSYDCTFSYSYTATVTTYSTTYVTNPGSIYTFTTPSTTLGPQDASDELQLIMNSIRTPSDPYGSSSFTVKLYNPSSVLLQTWSGITNTTDYGTETITYTAGTSMPTGVYTWTIQAEVSSNNNGTSYYPCSFHAEFLWYESISGTVYLPQTGTPQVFTMPASTAYPYVSFIAPTNVNDAVTFNVLSTTLPSNADGSSFFYLELLNSSNTTVWSANITGPVSYRVFNAALTGTSYKWRVTPDTTSNNIGDASFNCSMSFTYGWSEVDAVNTTFYEATPGPLRTYVTSNYTVAPQEGSTEIALTFANLEFPNLGAINVVGNFYLIVKLYDPNLTLLATFTVDPSSPLYLSPYINTESISGPYTITVQGFVTLASDTSSSAGTFPITYTLDINYQAAIEDELPTYLLVERALYMYLTADGWPFHAVLDLLDNPDTPLGYDTNNAMAGTRYAAIPTIHAY